MPFKFDDIFEYGKELTVAGVTIISITAIACWLKIKSFVKGTAKCEADKAVHEQRLHCQREYDVKFTAMEKDIKYIAQQVGTLTNTQPPRERN